MQILTLTYAHTLIEEFKSVYRNYKKIKTDSSATVEFEKQIYKLKCNI